MMSPPLGDVPYVVIGELPTTVWPAAGNPEPVTVSMMLVAVVGQAAEVVRVMEVVSVPVAGLMVPVPMTAAPAPEAASRPADAAVASAATPITTRRRNIFFNTRGLAFLLTRDAVSVTN